MRTSENILIIERVMQKQVPGREVKVTITITELCKFIQAARDDEASKKGTKTRNPYEDVMSKSNNKRFDFF